MRYIILLATVAAAVIGYSVYWFRAADEAEAAILAWIEARRGEGYEVSYKSLEVGGYPFRLETIVEEPVVSHGGEGAGWRFEGSRVDVVAAPWKPTHSVSEHSGPFSILYRRPDAKPLRLSGETQRARMSVVFDGGALERFSADIKGLSLKAEGSSRPMTAQRLQLHARRGAPAENGEDGLAQPLLAEFAFDVGELVAVGAQGWPLGDTIDSASLRLKIRGQALPDTSPDAIVAWRDGGGTVEIEALSVAWGALDLSLDGALALDEQNRVIGAVTVRIADHAGLIGALLPRAGEDGLKTPLIGALDALAKESDDPQGRLIVPLSFQDGEAFLGSFPIAVLPPLAAVGPHAETERAQPEEQ